MPASTTSSVKRHTTYNYILAPPHRLTISLIGCGGTGSIMLTQLARMDFALRALGHPGFLVTAIDSDIITRPNLARQMFTEADLGRHKCTVLIERVNRFFGLDWNCYEDDVRASSPAKNITISCVDSLDSRRVIYKHLTNEQRTSDTPYYWIDTGNSLNSGQVIVGSLAEKHINDLDENVMLKNFFEYFPKVRKRKEDADTPSCSIAQALNKQDLFINTMIAANAATLLWKLFREGGLSVNGVFVNLIEMKTVPICLM